MKRDRKNVKGDELCRKDVANQPSLEEHWEQAKNLH